MFVCIFVGSCYSPAHYVLFSIRKNCKLQIFLPSAWRRFLMCVCRCIHPSHCWSNSSLIFFSPTDTLMVRPDALIGFLLLRFTRFPVTYFTLWLLFKILHKLLLVSEPHLLLFFPNQRLCLPRAAGAAGCCLDWDREIFVSPLERALYRLQFAVKPVWMYIIALQPMIQEGNVDAIDAIAASCQAPHWSDVCQTKLCFLEQNHKAFHWL